MMAHSNSRALTMALSLELEAFINRSIEIAGNIQTTVVDRYLVVKSHEFAAGLNIN